MNRAAAFLERFRREETPLDVLADDPDGWADAMRNEGDALAAAIAEASSGGQGPLVSLHADCFATAACDRDGGVIACDPGFERWFGGVDPFDALVRDLTTNGPRVSMLADDQHGRPVALAAGTMAVARKWPLGKVVRAALEQGSAPFAIVAFRPGEVSWEHSARAWRLTPAEARLVGALARTGDLQRAASERGIAYETARKFVASSLEKTGSKRQTELVRLVLRTTVGDIPDARHLPRVVADLFGLNPRQSLLAVALAQGATRERAAEAAGVSVHRAKADLKIVFQACGVDNAVDLARLVAEVNALKGLASACEVMVTTAGRADEPLRLITRRGREGRIALSDHGPMDGKPVLVMHSTVTGRHHSPGFIARLQREGWRPLCVDRPGFGLTDRAQGDLIAASVADIGDVLDALEAGPMPVIARCTMASVIACEAARADLLTGGVLVWPDAPLPAGAPERRRMSDRAGQFFARFPALARSFAEMLCTRTSERMIEKQWRKAAEGLPGDLAVLDDPVERDALIHASRQAIQGVDGFLGEALALVDGPKLEPLDDGARWTALFGSGYESYDVRDGLAFWGRILPAGQMRVIDGGVHFLHVTHTDAVIEALERC